MPRMNLNCCCSGSSGRNLPDLNQALDFLGGDLFTSSEIVNAVLHVY
jgi:hypothetical protein